MLKLLLIKRYKSVALEDKSLLPHLPGIYYAICGNRILYIGQATNLHLRWNSKRFGDHHRLKDLQKFRNVRLYYKPHPKYKLDYQEALAIRALRPKLNVVKPRIIKPLRVCFEELLGWGTGCAIGFTGFMVCLR